MKTLKTVGQFLALNIKELLTFIAAAAGGGAFGIIFSIAITKTASGEEPVEYSTIGTILAIVFAVAVLIFSQTMGGQSDFYITISMNNARLPYLLGRYVLTILDILVSIGIIWLVNFLERTVIGPKVSLIGEVENLVSIKPEVVLVIVLVSPLVTIFCTAMYVIFERKFFWTLWGIYMICALGIPRIGSAMKNHPDSIPAKIGEGFAALGNIGVGPWLIIGGVMTVVLLIADIILYKKMEVKL